MENAKLIEGADGAPLFIQNITHMGNGRTAMTFFNGLTLTMRSEAFDTTHAGQCGPEGFVGILWRMGTAKMGLRSGAVIRCEDLDPVAPPAPEHQATSGNVVSLATKRDMMKS